MNATLPENVEAVLPLSPAQTGILFHAIGGHSTGAYVGVVTADIDGQLDATRFKAAFQEAVIASDALRAAFVWEGVKRPLQVVQRAVDVPWDAPDWQGLSPDAVEAETREVVERYQSEGFDLTRAPLMRVTLAGIGPEKTRLIWAVHHIISDGWSTRSVLDDVLERYGGTRVDRPRAQFRDYLGWLKARDASGDAAFWRDYLDGMTEPTRIATRANDEADTAGPHRHVTRVIPADVLDRAERTCRELRITPSTLMSAVWGLVLRRYARSDDVVFGATNAGRPVDLPGADRAAGAFLNTLPVRLRIDGSQPVSALLQSAEASMRQRTPFEASALANVQAWSGLPAGTPVFDYVFAFEGLPDVAASVGPLRIARLETRQTSNYPLTFLVTPEHGFVLEIYHDPAIFPDAVADAMLSDFARFLDAVLENPDRSVGDVSSVLPGLPRPDPVEVPDETILQSIAAIAASTPDAPAVSDEGGTLSYGALSAELTRISQMLSAAGIGQGDLVPVALPRGTDAVAAFLGVMAAGAAYVPIDITYPEERIKQVLQGVSAMVLLTTSRVPEYGAVRRLCIDDETAPRAPVSRAPSGADTAYAIFTSGSQGVPKGVPITHAALAHSTAVRESVYGGPLGTFLMLSSLAFDSSVVGLYWTLTTGGHLVIGDTALVQDPERLATVVSERRVQTMLCLPRLYDALLNAGISEHLYSLKTVIVAGEAVPLTLVETHRALGVRARLVNEYGPTEATVWCSSADLSADAGGADVPIGWPIPGVTMAVCDCDGRPLPDGVVGEIVVAGPTVSAGYLGAQTSDTNPFRVAEDGLQSYATGDLGVRGVNGAFWFLGRDDSQVKIRGHRVDMSEIEQCARKVVAPAEVCAVVLDRGAGASLAVCVATVQTGDLEERVQQAFEAELPAFARPARIHWTAQFPELPNGKVDQKALAAAVKASPVQVAEGTAPIGDTEARLAAIWCDVLGLSSVMREADFFDLGGDSLLSISLFAKAEQAGLPILPTDVFEHPTLLGLSAALVRRSAEPDAEGPAETPLKLENMEGTKTPVFLLHCNMWIYRQLARGLGPKWPVGLQFSHHFHGSQVALGAAIEDLAEEAIVSLRKLRATGPYILCGYSAGAMITLEIAQRLCAGGEDVPLVCLIDPPYDGRADRSGETAGIAMQGVSYARGMAARVMERFASDGEHHRRNVVSQAYALAMRRYRLAPYGGPVYVLLTDGNPAMAPGGTLSEALTMAEVESLPFDHEALLTDDEARLSLTSRIAARIKRL